MGGMVSSYVYLETSYSQSLISLSGVRFPALPQIKQIKAMYKLFNLKEEDNNVSVLYVTLPEGRTMAELTKECSEQIRDVIMEKRVFGRDIRIFGRITTSMAMVLGHELCHVARSVSMFDPKENEYVECIKH